MRRLLAGLGLLVGGTLLAAWASYLAPVATRPAAPPAGHVLPAATSSPTPTPSLSASPTLIPLAPTAKPATRVLPQIGTSYAAHTVTATWFYIGEAAGPSNDYISNTVSAWDDNWVNSYGGVDSPTGRNGWQPAGFVPRENPFYFALPYGDYDNKGPKANVTAIPWYQPFGDGASLLKNHWVAISRAGKTVYAQWEDVGPNEDNDTSYVFGSARPRNTFGEHAGIDISPAARDYLGTGDSATVTWRFVDAAAVPAGPWKTIVTTSGPRWN